MSIKLSISVLVLVTVTCATNMFLFVNSSIAQTSSVAVADGNSFYGDNKQPGNKLHTNIMQQAETGVAIRAAVSRTIDRAISNSDTTLNGKAKSAVAFDRRIANDFFDEMVTVNSLIDVTKTLIETNPEKIVHIITLGVILYPDFAQEVYDGAALTGLMNPDDILVAALQAGADPSTVSASTAVGETQVPVAAIPIGAGIGAGGTGGGDTTASSN